MGLMISGCVGPRENGQVDVRTTEQRAQRVIEEVFRAYQDRDLIGVMDRVATGYLGNRSTLERRLDDQLRAVDSIDYEWFISRVRPGDDDRVIDVGFRWDRRWRDVDSGAETRDSGTTTFQLMRENDRWLIKDIRGDNPFL